MNRSNVQPWISAAAAQRILCVGYDAFAALVADGLLSVREIPGSHPRYLRSEVEALATAMTRPARKPIVEARPCELAVAG